MLPSRIETSRHARQCPYSSDKAISQTESDDHTNYTTWKRKESGTPPLQETHRSGYSHEGLKPLHFPSPVAPSENARIHSRFQSIIYTSSIHHATTWKHVVDKSALPPWRRDSHYYNHNQSPPKKKWNNSYHPRSFRQGYCSCSLTKRKSGKRKQKNDCSDVLWLNSMLTKWIS